MAHPKPKKKGVGISIYIGTGVGCGFIEGFFSPRSPFHIAKKLKSELKSISVCIYIYMHIFIYIHHIYDLLS